MSHTNRSIDFRIVAPIIVVAVVLFAGMHFLAIRTIEDFARQSVTHSLADLKEQVGDICNRWSFEGDSEWVDDAAVSDLSALARIHDIELLVTAGNLEIIRTDGFPVELSADRGPVRSNGTEYYQGSVRCDILGWQIRYLQDMSVFDPLTERIGRIHATLLAMVIASAMLGVFYFRRIVVNPLRSIVGDIGIRRPPSRTGAALEFDILSDEIASMMLSLTEEKRAVDAERAFSRAVITNAGQGIIALDRDLRYTLWNTHIESITGIPSSDITGRLPWDVFPHLLEYGVDKMMRRALAGETVSSDNIPYSFPKTGAKGWHVATFSPQVSEQGDVIGVVGILTDTSESKLLADHMAESERRFREFTEFLPEIVFETDETGKLTYINRYATETTGYTADDIASGLNCIDTIAPASRQEAMERFKRVMSGEDMGGSEYVMLKKDGSTMPVLIRTRVARESGGKGLRGVIIDLTDLRKTEDDLRATLADRDLLLKEIHHRVKNNLMVIQSLLRLQSRDLPEGKGRDCFRESESRVRSMALIHERLYKTVGFTRIEFREYVSALLGQLVRSYQNNVRIRLVIDVPVIDLDIEIVIPCGLLLTELVSNSCKYAFSESREDAVIAVGLTRTEAGLLTLSVRDNGVGLPEGFSLSGSESLGMRIVQALAGQLGSQVEITRTAGTEFKITFSEKRIA